MLEPIWRYQASVRNCAIFVLCGCEMVLRSTIAMLVHKASIDVYAEVYFVPRIINSTSNLITMNNSKTMHTSSYSIAQILNDTVPLFIQ